MVELQPDDVRGIFDTGLDDSALQIWIDAATSFLSKAQKQQSATLSDDDAATVGKLLSAHFAAGSDPTMTRQSVGDNTFEFEGPDEIADGLNETRYGRRAVTLASVHGLDLQAVSVQQAKFKTFGVTQDRPRHW